jgi:hypothetical protein
METVTDPNFDGWLAQDGSGIGGSCAFIYENWVSLAKMLSGANAFEISDFREAAGIPLPFCYKS